MVTVEQIEKGFARWLDNELMPHFPANGWKKVVAGTAASIMIKRGGAMISSLAENSIVKALEVAKDGMIDIELLRDELKENMVSTGLKIDIPIVGAITLNKGDIDVIAQYIMEA